MTPQEIFEAAVNHMVTMGRRSGYFDGDNKFKCCYRTEHGDKCVAGLFIPDECYTEGMEGRTISDVLIWHRELPAWMHENWRLLGRLQLIHDRDRWDHIERGFRAVAEDFNLDVGFLSQYDFAQFADKEV